MRKSILMYVAMAALAMSGAEVWALGGVGGPGGNSRGGSNGGSSRKNFKPGTNKTFAWSRSDLNGARKGEKPILLYIYDSSTKNRNNEAQYWEVDMFPKDEIVEACKDMTYVMTSTGSKGWPPAMFQFAENGAMVAVMTADGNVVGFWRKGNRPSVNQFIAAVMRAKAANDTVVENMKKNPPPEFKDPVDPQQPPDPADIAEKKPEKPKMIPGLLDNDEEGKEKGKKEPSRPPEKKKKVEAFEEEEE